MEREPKARGPAEIPAVVAAELLTAAASQVGVWQAGVVKTGVTRAGAGRMKVSRTEVLAGADQILARGGELSLLAAATGQQADWDDLPYCFDRPWRLPYRPLAVLVYGSWLGSFDVAGLEGTVSQPQGGDAPLLGAVLVYGVGLPVVSGRVFTASNRRGRRTVFAPPAGRVAIAAIAAQVLLERGALFVNIDMDLGPAEGAQGGVAGATAPGAAPSAAGVALHVHGLSGVACQWALQAGIKRWDLPLRREYDGTLAQLGKRTRRNLRYYQRLCETELGCRFAMTAEPTREQFMALHREARYRVSAGTAAWRWGSLTRFPHVFLAGLQDREGRWLALVAGRRRGGETVVDWQVHDRRYARYSLATACLSFLTRQECALGSGSLFFEGGTTHAISDGLQPHRTCNLAVRRPWALLRLAERLPAGWARGNLLASALAKPWREWQACGRGR